jgi:hypothetical protein
MQTLNSIKYSALAVWPSAFRHLEKVWIEREKIIWLKFSIYWLICIYDAASPILLFPNIG